MTAPDWQAMGDSLNDRLPPRRTFVRKDAVDLLNDQLTVARNEFAAYRSMVEAQIGVLEDQLARMREICDAAYSVVRDDGAEDGWTTWQELVSALEDAGYEPRGEHADNSSTPEGQK